MNEDEKIKALVLFLRKSRSEGKHVKMKKLIEKCEKEKISYPTLFREVLIHKLEDVLI